VTPVPFGSAGPATKKVELGEPAKKKPPRPTPGILGPMGKEMVSLSELKV
jgi:hypothetical protein